MRYLFTASLHFKSADFNKKCTSQTSIVSNVPWLRNGVSVPPGRGAHSNRTIRGYVKGMLKHSITARQRFK